MRRATISKFAARRLRALTAWWKRNEILHTLRADGPGPRFCGGNNGCPNLIPRFHAFDGFWQAVKVIKIASGTSTKKTKGRNDHTDRKRTEISSSASINITDSTMEAAALPSAPPLLPPPPRPTLILQVFFPFVIFSILCSPPKINLLTAMFGKACQVQCARVLNDYAAKTVVVVFLFSQVPAVPGTASYNNCIV